MSSFDIHFIVSVLTCKFPTGNLGMITLSPESYTGVMVNVDVGTKRIQLQFLNSMKFISSSLDSLVYNLVGCRFDYIDHKYVAQPSC